MTMRTHTIASFLAATALALCCAGTQAGSSGETVKLVVSTIDGSTNYIPFWIALQNGELKAAGIEIEYLGFDGGPVQMEAYNSWDIGTTGIGGAIAGTVGHGGVILGAAQSDSSTQNFFARPDSPIVKAGQGKNSVGDKVYGDADTWRGAEILCGYGDVKHYCLIKVLEGFGLTIDDVNVLWMDQSSCITSFFSGQGDVSAVYGPMTYNPNVQKLVRVIEGDNVNLGLVTYLIANAGSLKDPAKRGALKKMVEIYYKNLEWMDANRKEAKDYLESYFDFVGFRYTDETAERFINDKQYISLRENVEKMFAKSDKSDYAVLQEMTADIIRFYERFEVYTKGTADKFLNPAHFDFGIAKDIHAARK